MAVGIVLVTSGEAPTEIESASANARAGNDGGEGRDATPAIEFAGCAAVLRGSVCQVDPQSTLRLWVPSRARGEGERALVVSTLDGPIAPVRASAVEGGTLLQFSVPKGATVVRVADGVRTLASLDVAAAPTYAWVQEVAALRESGKLAEAKELLEGKVPQVVGAERARAIGLLARVELARGELEAAVAKLYEAVSLDATSGLPSAEADDSFALAFALDQRLFRFTEARAVLERVARALDASPAVTIYPEAHARLPYYEGLVAADTNDARAALLRFTEAETRAARLGMARLARNARSSYAQQLANLGRHGDALAALAVLATSGGDEDPCDRLDVLNALGAWTLRALDGSERDDAYALHSGDALASVATAATAAAAASHGHLAHARASAGGAPQTPREPPHPIDLAHAEEALDGAAALYPTACADVNRHADVLLGLADVARRRGRLDDARAHLAEARRLVPSRESSVELAALALDARIALDEGAPARAVTAYDTLDRTAGSVGLAEWAYTTTLGRGEAYEAMGRSLDALAAYERAEMLIDGQSQWIPFEEGRSTFLADRERCARLHIDLLLRLGRDDEAFARARASRNRVIGAFERTARLEGLAPEPRARWEQSIEQYRVIRNALERNAADAWKWSGERLAREQQELTRKNAELRAALEAAFAVIATNGAGAANATGPTNGEHAENGYEPRAPIDAGELVLLYHPVRSGWVAFAATSAGVETARVDVPPLDVAPSVQAEHLLAPLRRALDRATRLRVLTYGPLRHIDVHALPWGDGVLLDHLPVTYGVDAAVPSVASRAENATDAENAKDAANATGVGVALVVADPSSDLPHALREARGVADALLHAPAPARARDVRYLVNDEADGVRIREILPLASLFHYAGHGRFAGRGGLESALALAEGGALTVGDILALKRAPSLVVLSGCETGRAASDGAGVGLGLAHAFVLAGARAVLAPVRPVEDALAEEVSLAVYRAFAAGTRDPASALREAQLAVRARAPASDWSAFRVVTP